MLRQAFKQVSTSKRDQKPQSVNTRSKKNTRKPCTQKPTAARVFAPKDLPGPTHHEEEEDEEEKKNTDGLNCLCLARTRRAGGNCHDS